MSSEKRPLERSTSDLGVLSKSPRTSVQKMAQVNRPTKEKRKCAKPGCNDTVFDKKAGIPCYLCNDYTHWHCAGITEGKKSTHVKAFLPIFEKKTMHIYYLCHKCIEKKKYLQSVAVPTTENLEKELKKITSENNQVATNVAKTRNRRDQRKN